MLQVRNYNNDIFFLFYHKGGFEDGDAGLNGEDEKSSTRLSLNRFFHDER